LKPWHLRSAKKHIGDDGSTSTKIKSAKDTLEKVIPICKKIGVTRLSDITNLDKLYIPNYSSVLPGTEDTIWVYGGKGTTKAQAKASALMEAIERYSSFYSTYTRSFIRGNYSQLSRSYSKVLHPDEVVEPVNQWYEDNSIMDFILGFDIMKHEEVLIPAQLALSRYTAESPAVTPFPYSHTNGLASGNVLEEAIYHGLCEVIERDAVSIADLSSSFIPYTILQNIGNSFGGAENQGYSGIQIPEDRFVDDPSLFPEVDISEVAKESKQIEFLLKRYENAGIPLLVKDITQEDIGVPTFVVGSVEWLTPDYGYFAKGYGASTDARIALTRAITEASQTRAVNIQGARDDLKKIKYRENDQISRRKWQFAPTMSSLTTKGRTFTKFSEIKTYSNRDILDDIRLILNLLKNAGLKRAIVVDLTNPITRIPVVRVIVPGLETFEVARLFTNNEALMGIRAKNHFVRTYACN
jgi:ribosomal protein S12 methylthiotransferase accessory factor YcaO